MIQIHNTPNSNALKFIPEDKINIKDGGKYRFLLDVENDNKSPLADAILNIDGTKEVFITNDFITVVKDQNTEWHMLRPLIIGAILEQFTHKGPIVHDASEGADADGRDRETNPLPDDKDSDTVKIKHIIDVDIRPLVARDGGDIEFLSFKDGIVTLKMMGACSGCISSAITLKAGIEATLKDLVPSVKEVVADGVEFDESEFMFLM